MSKSLSDNLKALVHTMAASGEAFLHHTFGERYTGAMLCTLLLLAAVTLSSPILSPETPEPLMPLFTVAFFCRMLVHLATVWQRRRARIHIPSYSSGISWSIWSELRLPVGVIHGIVEPLLCFAASFIVSPMDRVLSVWLRFTALALVIKTIIHRREAHEETLDALDDRMSARTRHTALQQQTTPRTPATATPVAVNPPVGQAPAGGLPGLFRNLDPALQRLMQQDAATTPGQAASTDERPANPHPDGITPRPEAAGRNAIPRTEPVHIWPASAARKPSAPLATPPAAAQASPRVVILRTRPAPATSRPAIAANSFGQETARATVRSTPPNLVAMPQVGQQMPQSSDAVPLPNAPEVLTGEHRNESEPPDKPAAKETLRQMQPINPMRGIDERIRKEAEKLGFVVEAEAKTYFSLGKNGVSVAVAIGDEVERVRSCLNAGLARIAFVSPDPERLKEVATALHGGLPVNEAMKVGYFSPDEFVEELARLSHLKNPSRPRTERQKERV